MSRHASNDDLACLAADCLKPRKAARIQAHMSQCPQCTQVSEQLAGVPTMLASTSYSFPAMPDQLSARIQTALAAESGQRLASAPPAEAGRGELPERAGSSRRGWRMPSFSAPSSRILATASALIILAGGGYEIATHVSGQPSQSASGSAGAEVPRAQASQLSLGPNVTYGGDTTPTRTIQTVTSDTNFVPQRLGPQVVAAVRAARLSGAVGAPHSSTGTLPPATSGTDIKNSADGAAMSQAQLAGCLDRLAPDRAILLVDLAKYSGKPATVIVAAANSSLSAEVWVVGHGCSASRGDVLDHRKLTRT
jgi:hypothetical protein